MINIENLSYMYNKKDIILIFKWTLNIYIIIIVND